MCDNICGTDTFLSPWSGSVASDFLGLDSNLTEVKFNFIWVQECVDTKDYQQLLPTKHVEAYAPPRSRLTGRVAISKSITLRWQQITNVHSRRGSVTIAATVFGRSW